MLRSLRWTPALLILLLLFCTLPAFAAPITLLTLKGVINPVAANYLSRGIRSAEKSNSTLILMLDTPGGLDGSMREMVQSITGAKIPVVVYVAPAGARAASAGLFLTMAAPVAAMAPNTAIGAAHPVGGQGEEIKGTMKDKVTNDAAAYIVSLAKTRGRNAEWAEKAVRQSVSLSSNDALKKGVIDLIAVDVEDLKNKLDGRTLKIENKLIRLRTKNEAIRRIDLDALESFLYKISEPSIAFILLNLGMLGLFFELSNPGAILPGVIGGICLLLAFFSLGMLPTNYAGVLLILFAFLLFVAELFVISYGILTIGGIIALVLGGLMLFNSSAPDLAVSYQVIWTVAISVAAFFFFAIGMGLRAHRGKITTGKEGLTERRGEARTDLSPKGLVFLNGELWSAVSESGNIAKGEEIVVESVEDLLLHVKRKEP
ncbi:MAG TPA: serine protease [Cyanobacteria bacterium UBA8530]|nr:serine protease [Cyanobacteria bacterium UBA8530]